MARVNRSDLPDGAFHVIAHAVSSEDLFRDDIDRRRYLGLLQVTVERYGWKVVTFVLMDTHVHLLVVSKVADLMGGLWWLNWRYAVYFNRRHTPRRGHVFEARPRTIPIQDDAYLLCVMRYIANNPVKASLCVDPAEFHWSAHAALVGAAPPIPFIDLPTSLGWFGDEPARARDAYAAFVNGPTPENEELVVRAVDGIPRDRPALAELVGPGADTSALQQAHRRWHYTVREIAAVTGLSKSTVSRRVN